MESCITADSYISAQDCYRSAALETAKEEGEGLFANREAEEEMARLNAQFEKFWAQHGEMLVWKLWVQKYPDQVHYHQLAPMPAVQEVEVGGEVERRPAEGTVTMDKRHGEGEGGNSGVDGHSGESKNGGEGRHSGESENGGEGRHSGESRNGGEGRHSGESGNGGEGRHNGDGGEGRQSAGGGTGLDCKGVPVADVSAQDTLVASKQSMDASGDAHIHALGLKLDASLGSAVDASGDASAAQPLQRGRVLSDTLPPGGEVPHGSVTHQGVSTQSHLSGTFPACVGEVSVGDVEDNTQPCPGEKSQSDTTVEVAVKCELEEGNIPTTHLTSLNLAIHSTMSRVREDLSSGLTSDQKKDTCVEGSTGYAVGGTETSMVHMMHTYASKDGGSRGEHHGEQDEDEAGNDSDGSPVRRLCIITFNIYCVAFNIYIIINIISDLSKQMLLAGVLYARRQCMI